MKQKKVLYLFLLLTLCVALVSCKGQAETTESITTNVSVTSAETSTFAESTTAEDFEMFETEYVCDITGDGILDTCKVSVLGAHDEKFIEDVTVLEGGESQIKIDSPLLFVNNYIFRAEDEERYSISYGGEIHTFEKSRLATPQDEQFKFLESGDTVDYTVMDGKLVAYVSIACSLSEMCGKWEFVYVFKDGKMTIDHVYIHNYTTGKTADLGGTTQRLESYKRRYYFNQNYSGYSTLELNEVSAEDFAALDNSYHVFTESYPAHHGGILYDTGDEYNSKMLKNINEYRNILEHLQAHEAVTLDDVEITNGSVLYKNIQLTARADTLSLIMERITIPDAYTARKFLKVDAMLMLCGITDPIAETTYDRGEIIHTFYQDYGDAVMTESAKTLRYVTVSSNENESKVYIQGKLSEDKKAEGFLHVNNYDIIADLNSKREKAVTTLKYDIVYSGVDYFGYSIPCYMIYVPIEGTDDFELYFYRMQIMDMDFYDLETVSYAIVKPLEDEHYATSVEDFYASDITYKADLTHDGVEDICTVKVVGHGTECYEEELIITDGKSGEVINVFSPVTYANENIEFEQQENAYRIKTNGKVYKMEKETLDTPPENLCDIGYGNIVDYTVIENRLFCRMGIMCGIVEVCGEIIYEYSYKDGKMTIAGVELKDWRTGSIVDFETSEAGSLFDISASELQSRMERYEFAGRLPEEPYTINVTGHSVPVTLYMNLDCVTAVEAYGHRVTLEKPRDIYGNCNFDLFEYDGAIIIEGGYYGIGEVHILTADGTSTVQHKDNASYYLHINDSGELYYKLLHNGIAGISQTGGLTVATSYDEFLSAEGYASIDGCNVVFDEAYESYVISDKYDLDKEFELNYKQDYASIEEKFAENAKKYGIEVTTEVATTVATTAVTTETTTATKEPTEPKYITETVTFDFVDYFEGSIEVGGGTFDGDITMTYTYAEGLKPAGFSLFDVSGDEDFPENGYYEEMQTHNGWRPAWATVTKRSILRRDSGDILIEYVDGENNGPVLAYWRASDDYIIEFGFSECSFVTDADIEMLANTFVFKGLTVEDWTYTYITPNYDAWEETEGEYVIWEFTKNADGEFELTYSEGDILCIPYVTIGSDKVIYATTKTIIPPALEIGKLHILKAHDEIIRLFLEDTLEGSVGTKVADGIYAENFAKYCEEEPEKADVLRERSGKLRNVFKVYINGEAVDGIGVALPSYCFIKDYQYEWQFLFSKAYAKEDVNTVRIELKIPEQQESTASDVSQSEPANVLSGSCGEGVSYTFDTDSGEVRIFGTGEMSYYGDEFVPCGFAPWHYDARVKSVVIEDGVTSICDMAFYGCTALSNVTIPQSVTSIGRNAFNGCHSLREISVPDSVTYIGDGTFTYCDSLKEFVIPQGVTSISPSMFFACEKLEKITIPDTVTYIGYDAFERCNLLSEISIPSSVTGIGELAFAYCSSLKEITLPQGVTNLNRGIFYNCTALEKIALPEGLTSIGVTVFHGSTALLEITIPGSVTSIDETAFIYGNLSLVRAPLGSYAERFAKNNNIEFEEVNDYVS